MLVKDTKFTIDARKKQLIQQDANALKDAKLRGSCLCCVALVYPLLESPPIHSVGLWHWHCTQMLRRPTYERWLLNILNIR